MAKIKFKNIIKEHNLGELPSEKLIKMKWNPLTDQDPSLNEGPNAWKRMDGLHNLKLMKQIETNAATLVKEFSEEGFGEEDVRAWFDRQLIKVIKRNM